MSDWTPHNYFNYFTEVEEHFQRARGTGLWLMSPIDWALVEAWKDSGLPIEAVLRGIDAAFEKHRSRKNKTQQVNSITYCTQAIMEEARNIEKGLAAQPSAATTTDAPFTLDDLRAFLTTNAQQLTAAGHTEAAESLAKLTAELETHYANLEELEQRLTAIEQRIIALERSKQSEEELFEARRQLDSQLRPYRGKMDASQLAMLERQYMDRRLFDRANLPRLSLFYLH